MKKNIIALLMCTAIAPAFGMELTQQDIQLYKQTVNIWNRSEHQPKDSYRSICLLLNSNNGEPCLLEKLVYKKRAWCFDEKIWEQEAEELFFRDQSKPVKQEYKLLHTQYRAEIPALNAQGEGYLANPPAHLTPQDLKNIRKFIYLENTVKTLINAEEKRLKNFTTRKKLLHQIWLKAGANTEVASEETVAERLIKRACSIDFHNRLLKAQAANTPASPVDEENRLRALHARAKALDEACKLESIKRDKWLALQQKKRALKAAAQQKDGKKKKQRRKTTYATPNSL